MIVVVMGVSGSGKSTLGRRLASHLGLPFLEGDSLHPPDNRARMKAGLPLREEHRAPWLDSLAAAIAEADGKGTGLVLTCSALRLAHRDRLRAAAPGLRFVHLAGPEALIEARLRERRGHFMPPQLLGSQLAALEPPQGEPGVVTLDTAQPVEALVEEAARRLRAV